MESGGARRLPVAPPATNECTSVSSDVVGHGCARAASGSSRHCPLVCLCPLSSSLSRRVVCTPERDGYGVSPLSLSLYPRIIPIHSLPYIKDSSSRGHGDVSAVTRAVCLVVGVRGAWHHATPRHHHKLINKKQQPASIHRVEYTLIFMVLAAASTDFYGSKRV